MTDLAPIMFEMATNVSTPWSLAAFGTVVVAMIIALVVRKGRGTTTRPIAVWGMSLVALLCLGPIGAWAYREAFQGVYRVRTTIVNSRNTPVQDARVWSDVGGEWQQAAGGWEVTIPKSTLPAGRQLVVRASRPDAFEQAVDSLVLGDNYNPKLTLRLAADTTATVRGTVVDVQGRAVAGARVYVEGYGAEGVLTDGSGAFVLAAHAADGQQVLLRAERSGVDAVSLYHPAGREPATLELHLAAPPK